MPHIQEYLEPGASAPHRQRGQALPDVLGLAGWLLREQERHGRGRWPGLTMTPPSVQQGRCERVVSQVNGRPSWEPGGGAEGPPARKPRCALGCMAPALSRWPSSGNLKL